MNRRAFLQNAAATAVAAAVPAPALFAEQATPNTEPGWWMVEPIRAITHSAGYSEFILPVLEEYELLDLG